MAPSDEIPLICDSCLGDCAALSIKKYPNGGQCNACELGCHKYRIPARGPGTRPKNTVICRNCAALKNICQICMFDMVYGLPAATRDHFEAQGVDPNASHTVVTAGDQRVAGKARHAALDALNRSRAVGGGQVISRNKIKICAYFLRGACNRGATCPYRHELPKEGERKGGSTIKQRYMGVNDAYATGLISKAQKIKGVVAPSDGKVTTLRLSNIAPTATRSDIMKAFGFFGKVAALAYRDGSPGAQISFLTRKSAETAARRGSSMKIRGAALKVLWADSNLNGASGEVMQPQGQISAGATVGVSALGTGSSSVRSGFRGGSQGMPMQMMAPGNFNMPVPMMMMRGPGAPQAPFMMPSYMQAQARPIGGAGGQQRGSRGGKPTGPSGGPINPAMAMYPSMNPGSAQNAI